jgi:pimeloyl-ACP methyl ester carboxylesterase
MTAVDGDAREGGDLFAGASRWVDLDGPVHFVDYGGPEDGPLLVLVHGLGGSVANWAAVGPQLARSARVVAIDLAGFGRTRSDGRATTVHGNQELLHRFLTEVTGTPAVLVGNSMGGLISVLQTDAHPDTVAGLVLVDPALPVGVRARPHPLVALIFATYAVPAVGRTVMSRRQLVRSTEQQAMDVLRLCTVNPSRIPEEVLQAHLAVALERAEHPDVDAELVVAARSLLWVLARRRQHAAMLARITAPVLLLHGDRDRLVPVAAARATAAANPLWTFEVARGVGHVPQLEDPVWTVHQVLGWLAGPGRAAAMAAATGRAPERRPASAPPRRPPRPAAPAGDGAPVPPALP